MDEALMVRKRTQLRYRQQLGVVVGGGRLLASALSYSASKPARRAPQISNRGSVGQQAVVLFLDHCITLAGAPLKAWPIEHRDVPA